MSRIILLAPLCVLLMVAPALGTPVGPTPPGGWGTDCTNWTAYSNPWASAPLCYDPLLGSGGEGWRDCLTGVVVEWPALDIELWIEMACTFYWDETHVQIHRFDNYNVFNIYLDGGSSCNNGQYIITTPPSALGSLDYLPFDVDMFGRDKTASGATDIPLTWWYDLDGAGFLPMIVHADPPGSKYFLVEEPCDHSWRVKITGTPIYHQADGYYYLGGPGCFTCPVNPM